MIYQVENFLYVKKMEKTNVHIYRSYFDDHVVRVALHGVEVKIIDFTLSRMSKGQCRAFFGKVSFFSAEKNSS